MTPSVRLSLNYCTVAKPVVAATLPVAGSVVAHDPAADDAIVRLVGAILLEQNDEWAVQRARYMTLETIAPLSDDPLISLPAVAR